MSLDNKLAQLKKALLKMDSVLVAYSGGSDSAFLLKVAKDILGDKVIAVTADSATYPKDELKFAKQMANRLGVKHIIIKTGELKNNNFLSNPRNRCYFCKKELFSKLKNIAREKNINFVIDATNSSDKKDFRPGSIAKKQLGVRSPLEEAGISKEDVRRLSKNLGLPTWNKPPLACLASRIPYGTKITNKILRRINEAEGFIKGLGFSQVRLRHYNGLARIEVLKKDIPRLIKMGRLITDRLRELGYNYATVDLEGYRTGSLNITPGLKG
jgi:uncharacterized protein